MRLMVRGPTDFDDYDLVKKTLNKVVAPVFNVVLISDQRPGMETHLNPSSFPLGEKWIQEYWKRNARRGHEKSRYSTIVRHHCPFDGDKQWTKGVKARRLNMILDATMMVAFWDVGGQDFDTEEMIRLAGLYDLKHLVVRV